MIGDWKNIPEFKDLRVCYDSIDGNATYDSGTRVKAIQEKKINDFFKYAYDEHKKMFARWFDPKKLGFLGAFSEVQTGSIVARRLLNRNTLPEEFTENVDFDSPNHGRKIDLRKFSEFVEEKIEAGVPNIVNYEHNQNNKYLYEKIAEGYNIWDRSSTDSTLRRIILSRYGHTWTSQHASERANKAQNLANSNQRGEANSSIRLMAQSGITEMSKARVLGEKRDFFRGGPKIKQASELIHDQIRKVEALETKYGVEEFKKRRTKRIDLHKGSFERVLVNEENENFTAAFQTDHEVSVKERRAGIDIAPLVKDLIQFGKLFDKMKGRKTGNMEALQHEMNGRNHDENATLPQNINDIKKWIKEHEKMRCNRDKEEFDERYFRPLHTLPQDYEFNLN